MTLFNDKVYEFLTQPDNWQIAKEVYDKMPEIMERLSEEFWTEVKKTMESRLDLKEWKVEKADNFKGSGDSGMCITHLSWKDLFHIGFGKLEENNYLAVWCNPNAGNISAELYNWFASALMTKCNILETDPEWWPGWYSTGEDLSQSLVNILPLNRQKLNDRYSAMLMDLKDKATPIIDAAMSKL